ncbi:MAG: hypothetical protein ACFFBX_02245 [Promethearchaeota archaeon]
MTLFHPSTYIPFIPLILSLSYYTGLVFEEKRLNGFMKERPLPATYLMIVK